ncbi:MAG: subtilisin family serine protease [Halieaceae bacterium]|jgi:subtilisin family serine protease
MKYFPGTLQPLIKCALLCPLLLAATLHPLSAGASESAAQTPGEKRVIEKKDDLPRHSYQLELPVSALYAAENRESLVQLAMALKADVLADLDTYDIRDSNTVQGFYGVLGAVALLEEDWEGYLALLEKRRALETKAANRLTMGLLGESIARAELEGQASGETIAGILREKVQAMPYSTVASNLESLKGRSEFLTSALLLGSLESNYQPVVDRNGGEISYDIGAALVGASFSLDYFIPHAAAINTVLAELIAANHVEKPDIWAGRQIVLQPDADATPVTLAVWDSGVDTAIFAASDQLWRNTSEIPANGIDDDDNGFVDDLHGIAFDLHSNKVGALLYPIGGITENEAALQQMVKGIGDLQFNVDSEAASAVRKAMAALPQTEVKAFLESLGAYGNYSHGTHVAGIAAEGNPLARILVARMTYGHTMIPEKPTLAQAHREAAMFLETSEYFRGNGVRVVNMSWGGSLRSIEQALEANAAGQSADERKALAREIYTIGDKALRHAISSAPEILFVTSSGNSDNDIRFDEFYPSSYNYPNLLTVGAVDIAGDETSFTSLGKVDIYANGFEVESYVPGGNRIAYNGTSMSSPQVMNLAGKVLAHRPELSSAELKSLIIRGADEKALESRSIRLMNPRKTLQLARTAP